jgi:ATP-dependent helicase HrpB
MFDLYINLINRKATPEFLTVDFRALQRIRASVKQISTKFGIVPLEEKFNFTNSDFLEAEKAVLSAFPDRVGVIRGNTNQRAYKLVDGSGYRLTNSSIVKDADMVVGLSIDKNPGASGDGKIYCAMEINPVWLEEVCPHLVAVKKEIRFDPKTASIVKERSKIFQSLVLEVNREDIQLSDQIAIESALQKEVASNIAAYFDLKNDDYLQIKFRVKLLKSYPEGEFLKNFDENWIKEKLSEFTTSCRSIRDIRAISLVERYLGELPYKQQMEFEKLVPTRYPLPSGNSAKIVYQESGAPLLKVKLQEMFGTSDTPTIINGRQSLLIQLLSPAGRPLQLTQDLKSFWENGYPLIAKEMKGKYPKHPWPDSPSTATPFGGTKKQFARKKQ